MQTFCWFGCPSPRAKVPNSAAFPCVTSFCRRLPRGKPCQGAAVQGAATAADLQVPHQPTILLSRQMRSDGVLSAFILTNLAGISVGRRQIRSVGLFLFCFFADAVIVACVMPIFDRCADSR